MPKLTKYFILFLFCTANTSLFGQQIKGIIEDRAHKNPLANVQLVNVYNNNTAFSDSLGNFIITAKQGELIEVRYAGFNITRFRLSQGYIPPFFKIYLDSIIILNPDRYASSGLTKYQIDSIYSHELYSPALDYHKMSAFEQIESPFTALSRSNQEKWRFQESYAMFEREKYIDFTFNDTLITKITGLEGPLLVRYMKIYRPSYEVLRSMSQYDYYMYIRQTAERFKRNMNSGIKRNSG